MTTVAVRLAIAAVAVGTTTAFAVSANPLDEPFAWLHATLPGQAEPNSPDPLVATRWTASTNTSQLQIYTASPVAVTAPCAGLTKYDARRALRGRAKTSCVLNASAAVTLDFGVERAAWFEFRLAPGSDDAGLIAGLSEYQYPRAPGADLGSRRRRGRHVVWEDSDAATATWLVPRRRTRKVHGQGHPTGRLRRRLVPPRDE